MERRLEFFRVTGERALPTHLVEPVKRRGGRPKRAVQVRVRSPQDVETLRRRKLPLFLLSSDEVTAEGYPIIFEPRLVLPESMVSQVHTTLRLLPVRNEATARDASLETLATVMLRVNTLAARALLERNRPRVRPGELYRAVMNEGLARAATKVRFQDFAKELPLEGPQLSVGDLRWVMQNNPPSGPDR